MRVKNKQYVADVGEVFQYEGVMLKCCKDTVNAPCYFKEAGRKSDCCKFACCKNERPDKTSVKFINCEKKEKGGK